MCPATKCGFVPILDSTLTTVVLLEERFSVGSTSSSRDPLVELSTVERTVKVVSAPFKPFPTYSTQHR